MASLMFLSFAAIGMAAAALAFTAFGPGVLLLVVGIACFGLMAMLTLSPEDDR